MKVTKKLLTLVSIFTLTTTASAANFPDVTENTEYQTSINWMAEQGIVEGYQDGNFRPNQEISRAEFLKLLFLTLEIPTSAQRFHFFTDTPETAWYMPYVNTSANRNVINGYPDKTFRPHNTVNAVEATKMALGELSKLGIHPERENTDIPEGTWYKYSWEASLGGNLLPSPDIEKEDLFTRQQAVELLYRTKTLYDHLEREYSSNMEPKDLRVASIECPNAFQPYQLKYLPISLCFPEYLVGVYDISSNISHDCQEGRSFTVKTIDDEYFISYQSEDFLLTCEHGVAPIVQWDCLKSFKDDGELQECFRTDDVNYIERHEVLDGVTAYEVDMDVPGFDGGMNNILAYFIPDIYQLDGISYNLRMEGKIDEIAIRQDFIETIFDSLTITE